MDLAALTAAFVFGLAGSLHCVGMCGPLVLLLAQDQPSAAQLQLRQGLYYLGKTGAYALLGAVAGALGAGLGALFAGMQDVLSVALGLVLVGMGIGLMRNARWLEGGGALARLPGFRAALAFFIRRRSAGATLGLGFLNGFLPCGLVYAALAMAVASGSALGGALAMAAFGLATVPALFAVAVSGYLLRPAHRARLSRLAGAVAVVAGAVTVLRGTPWMGHVMHLLHHVGPSATSDGPARAVGGRRLSRRAASQPPCGASAAVRRRDGDDELAAGVAGLGLLERRHRVLEGVDALQDEPEAPRRDVVHEPLHVGPDLVGPVLELLDADAAHARHGVGVAGDGDEVAAVAHHR